MENLAKKTRTTQDVWEPEYRQVIIQLTQQFFVCDAFLSHCRCHC